MTAPDAALNPMKARLRAAEPALGVLVSMPSVDVFDAQSAEYRAAVLPPEVQEIMVEVASDYEQLTGANNLERYGNDIETLQGLITVKEVDPQVRLDWANALSDWPKEMVADLEAQGLLVKVEPIYLVGSVNL